MYRIQLITIVAVIIIVSVVNFAYGQEENSDNEPMCLQAKSVIYKDEYIVLIDLTAEYDNLKCMSYYASQGYEIKEIVSNPAEYVVYMQK